MAMIFSLLCQLLGGAYDIPRTLVQSYSWMTDMGRYVYTWAPLTLTTVAEYSQVVPVASKFIEANNTGQFFDSAAILFSFSWFSSPRGIITGLAVFHTES